MFSLDLRRHYQADRNAENVDRLCWAKVVLANRTKHVRD
jgi:hypothetical protein